MPRRLGCRVSRVVAEIGSGSTYLFPAWDVDKAWADKREFVDPIAQLGREDEPTAPGVC